MIWLIGNQGMLGHDVEKVLQREKRSYRGTDREVDITDESCINSFVEQYAPEGIEWMINCSAYTAVDKAEDEPELAFRINGDGVYNIARIAASLNTNLIHISTDYVFSGTKQSDYSENDETDPLGVYGKSKLAGERKLISSCDTYFILRTAWLFGINGRNFVNTMIRLFGERDKVRVVCDQKGSPTYTKDLAEAIMSIVKKNSKAYGIYHYTNLGTTTWYGIACEIANIAYTNKLIDNKVEILPIKTEEFPTRAMRPMNSCLSKQTFIDTFGLNIREWQPALKEYLTEDFPDAQTT